MWIAIASTAWIAGSAWMDHKRRQVSNRWMGLGFLGASALFVSHSAEGRIAPLNLAVLALTWVVSLALWNAGLWGGADAKFIMIITLAFPDPLMALCMFFVHASAPAGVWISSRIRRKAAAGTQLPAMVYLAIGWGAWLAGALIASGGLA
jgi:Flp pilus assembly protein protease CpaA